jgi:hypothetical protein
MIERAVSPVHLLGFDDTGSASVTRPATSGGPHAFIAPLVPPLGAPGTM